MSRTDTVIKAVVAALEAQRGHLEDGDLRRVALEVTVSPWTGGVTVARVTPTYATEVAAARSLTEGRGCNR